MNALPHHLNDFADALSVLPSRDRAAAATSILAEACVDAAALRASGVQSVLAIPLSSEAAVTGALTLTCVREERLWPDEIVPRASNQFRINAR